LCSIFSSTIRAGTTCSTVLVIHYLYRTPHPASSPFTPVFRSRIHKVRIRIQHFRLIRIQGFDEQKLEKITAENKIGYFFEKKLQFQFSYP
jgi:hypothetical protein